MRRLWRYTTGSRRRKIVAAVIVVALVLAAAGLAAFGIFTGADGSGQGTYGPSTPQVALTFTGSTQPVLTGPGDAKVMTINAVNHDTVAQHTLGTFTAAFTSNPVACASHLTMSNVTFSGAVFAANFNASPGSVTINTDATTPVACAGGTWAVAFSGTTTP